MTAIPEALVQARQSCQAGDLARAEALCRQILRAQPAQVEALYLLGGVCHRLRRLEEALGCFEKVQRLQPRSAEPHYGRGLVFQDLGDLAGAVRGFREAARLRPGFVAAHSNLGLALEAQGKAQEAEASFREVLRLCPKVPEAHAHLAGALQAQGKLDVATACFQEALRLKPDFAAAHNNLGNLWRSQGKRREAALCFEEAIRLQPGFAEAHYNLGNLLKDQGRIAEAAACYQRAIGLNPEFAEAYNALGMVCAQEDQRGPALDCFQQALRLQPTYPEAHCNLGSFLLEEGQREQAGVHFQDALRLDPHCVPALAAVAYFGLFPLTQADLARADALLANPNLLPVDASRLHFGLGSLRDRAGAHGEAFTHFQQANALRRRVQEAAGVAFDAGEHSAWVNRMIATCDEAYFRKVKELGRDTERPVFIVGMPRSGTSLVEQILASHPDVFGAGELDAIDQLAKALPSRLGSEEGYPACLAGLDGAVITALADEYLRRIERLGGPASRVTDKMPLNFLHLGLIAALFPRARIIHCRRDPLDVCFSCYIQDFRGGLNFSSDLKDLGRYYQEYERLMAHWRSLLPLSMLEVVYEELVDNQEAVSRRLLSFCGLEWNDGCLSYHQNPRPVRTCSQLQVRQPIYKSSVGRWRPYAAYLRPLQEALERPPDPNLASVQINRGKTLLTRGKWVEAADCFREALHLQPESAEANYRLGNILHEQGQWPEAAACYQRTIHLQPGFAPAYNALGMLCVLDDQPGPALDCFQQALRLQPTLADVHANFGTFLLQEGRREEALDHFRAALGHDPNCVPALAAVAYHGLYPLTDAELTRIRALLGEPGMPPEDASRLHCALGNLSDRAGAYDEAFAHVSQANALRRGLFQATGTAFDAGKHRAWIERIIATCDAAYFRRIEGLGRETQRPVFIVGMPRSGTSLVEQILASHPEVCGAGELKDIGRLTEALPSVYPECQARLDGALANRLADQYLGRLSQRSAAALRVTDKMPMNFLHLGLIAALFPRARVIHCVRDPRDLCLSCYFQDFQSVNFAWDLEDLGRYHVEYERLMKHWRSVLPLPLLEVVYERLVSDPEAVSRQLVSFCGLDWDDRCLNYHQNLRAVRTTSLLQVRQPVYKSSVGRWRHYAAHLRPLLDALGRLPEPRKAGME